MSSSLVKYESVNNQPGIPGTVNDITTDLQPENGHAFRRVVLSAPRGGLPAGTWLVLYWAGDSTSNDYTSQVQLAINATQMWFRESSGLNTWNTWQQSNGSPLTGVLSFNGRIGVVVPATNDYIASQVGVTPVGTIPGPELQNSIAYLGTIYNSNNGFYEIGAISQVISPSSNVMLQNFSPLATYGYGDPNFTGSTGIYVPTITGRYDTKAIVTFSVAGVGTTAIGFDLVDITSGNTVISGTQYNAIATTENGGMTFAAIPILIAGHQFGINMTTGASETVTIVSCLWSLRLVQF